MADMQWVMGADASLTEAYIENEDGNAVVAITRLTNPGLKIVRLPTDEQWQSIVDCIAAAPEMLGTLKDIRREIRAGSILDAGNIEAWGAYIDELLAKAEPPRKVKNTVHVTVQVEIETDSGEASHPGNVAMAAVEAVRDGKGAIIHNEIVTERARGLPQW